MGHTRPFFGHLAPFVKIDDRVLERAWRGCQGGPFGRKK